MLPQKFVFDFYKFTPETGALTLGYEIEGYGEFQEKIQLGVSNRVLSEKEIIGLDNVLRGLWIACGMSYYKAFCPEQLEIKDHALNASEAAFFEKLYVHGLGEFAFRNDLDLRDKIKFPFSALKNNVPQLTLPVKTAIPIGGGKDSLVTVEQLKETQKDLVLVRVNRHQPIEDCIELSGLPDLFFERKLDPKLFELNKQDGVYNGHVPITSIISFILAAGSIIYGYDAIAFSNEKSANQGNTKMGDLDINHQYSKSLEFEADFQNYLTQNCFEGLHYYSHLRAFSELEIAQMFVKTDKYDAVFTSCNRNFKLIKSGVNVPRWCGDCPKCRFVFLALATAMEKERLLSVFGKNMLDEVSQLSGYQELTGETGLKPWECVGEIEESQEAAQLLKQKSEWLSDVVLTQLNV